MKSFFITALLFSTGFFFQVMGQNKPCIFCQIANEGKQESHVVYKDKRVVAFMDHKPQNTGHVLVVPRVHTAELLDVSDATAGHMLQVARKIARAIRLTDIPCEAFRFQLNSGEAAGQTVFHSHLHIIPRFKGDDPNGKTVSNDELDAIAKKIREALKGEGNR